MSAFSIHRFIPRLGAALLAGASAMAAPAMPLPLRAIDFGDGVVATGSVTTDDASGAITDWRVALRSTTRLAHFTRANTSLLGLEQTAVSNDGLRLTVASGDAPGNIDGGQLLLRNANPSMDFGTALADFTGANAGGGQASYMAGSAFDWLALGATPGSDYTVASASQPGSHRYTLNPLSFADGVTVFGSLLTDGSSGALGVTNLLAWDIYVEQLVEDVFDRGNSVISATQVAFDPTLGALVVDNPDGSLSFNKPALGGRSHALVLADFSDPQWPQGKAAYYQGRLAFYERSLGAARGAWRITGSDAVTVPEPGALTLSVLGLFIAGVAARRRQ